MPCLIIAGHPSAGKTTLANLLRERALKHDAIDEVVVLNEESECGCNQEATSGDKIATTKQDLYETSYAEKQTRGALKAAFDRAVKKSGGGNNTSRRLVILDSMNYIKGFRYELHCISKASGEKHGILWVLNRVSVVQEWNKSYSPELLNELISRFEPPDERNRWDKPLFTVDVAAAAGKKVSSSEDDEITNKVSSKNEVLENSVYNMHSLGEAFGTQDQTSDAKESSEPQKPIKSAFSRKGPKKSAFSRRNKATPAAEKPKPTTTSNSENNQFILDTSILTSPPPSETERSDNKPKPTVPPPTASKPEEDPNSKTLEEQLDDILNTFLLQTRNLKEGMSTRQYE